MNSVFLLSLFNCVRFSRHGLTISGFPVSGQAVFGSSTYGWAVWWDRVSHRWHIFVGLKKCCFLRKKLLLCHFDTLGDKSPSVLFLTGNTKRKKRLFQPQSVHLFWTLIKGRLLQNSRPKTGGYTRWFSVRMPTSPWYYWGFQKILYHHSYHKKPCNFKA